MASQEEKEVLMKSSGVQHRKPTKLWKQHRSRHDWPSTGGSKWILDSSHQSCPSCPSSPSSAQCCIMSAGSRRRWRERTNHHRAFTRYLIVVRLYPQCPLASSTLATVVEKSGPAEASGVNGRHGDHPDDDGSDGIILIRHASLYIHTHVHTQYNKRGRLP